jgi:hypothetical protein
MASFYVVQRPQWVTAACVASVIAAGAAINAQTGRQTGAATPKEPVPVAPDSAAQAEFTAKVNEYVELHKNLEQGLARIPEDATREVLFERQQTLFKRLQAARTTAKQGDVFTLPMQTYVRRMIAKLFAGPAGGQLRASIMDENPVSVKLRVNMPYPTTVPLATMPPTVLASLPNLPDVLQYRFIGDDLILLDKRAQMIADFVPQVLPK